MSLAASAIVENSAAGTVIGGILGATSGSTLSLADNAGGRFAISGGNLVAGAASTNYEAATSHSITIHEMKAGYSNSPRDTVLTVTVTNVYEQASLSALTLSATSFTIGTPTSGAINGATAGSTISASGLPTGLTINGAARTWAYDGTGAAATSSITLTETLVDSANSPKDSSISVTLAAAWAPTGFGSSLKAWYDASDNATVFSDAGTTQAVAGTDSVRQWNDKSGNGYHLGEVTAKPSYLTDALNSKKAVKFTAASTQRLSRTDSVGTGLAAVANGTDVGYTLVFAARRGTPGVSVTPMAFHRSTAARWARHYISSSNAAGIQRVDDINTTVTASATTANMTSDVWYIVTLVFTGTTMSIWVNGAQVANAISMNVGTITLDSFALGALYDGGAASWGWAFGGALGEVLVTSVTTRDANVTAAETYLAAKWQ